MSAFAFAHKHSSSTANAIDKARDLPDAKHGKAVPFPYADRMGAYKNKHSNREINHAIEKAPIEKVPLDKLHAIQHSVNLKRLDEYIKHPDAVPDDMRGPKAHVPVDHPIVIKQDGKLYIHDGHHRCTASKLSGDKMINARIVDFDESSKSNVQGKD